jgi:hypothetical protein
MEYNVAQEVATTELLSVREFKSRVTRLIREKKVVLILKRGQPVGYFVPWDKACAEEPLNKKGSAGDSHDSAGKRARSKGRE